MRKDVIVCSRIVFGSWFKVIAVKKLVRKFRIWAILMVDSFFVAEA